jgi:hypothetical protein
MGMEPYSYVVAGVKTTIQQCNANDIDIWSGDFDEGVNEHDIRAITGEGTDDVLIGKVLFEADPYNDTDHAIELTMPEYDEIFHGIQASGVNVEPGSIRLYAITVWL